MWSGPDCRPHWYYWFFEALRVEYIANLICLLACCLPTVTAQAGQPQLGALHFAQVALFEHKTRRIVGHFSTSGRTLVASVVDLAYSYELPMAVEYAERDATTRPLNLEFNNQPIQPTHENIIPQAPQYRDTCPNNIVDIFAPRAR